MKDKVEMAATFLHIAVKGNLSVTDAIKGAGYTKAEIGN
jgi:hypothetical protein